MNHQLYYDFLKTISLLYIEISLITSISVGSHNDLTHQANSLHGIHICKQMFGSLLRIYEVKTHIRKPVWIEYIETTSCGRFYLFTVMFDHRNINEPISMHVLQDIKVKQH